MTDTRDIEIEAALRRSLAHRAAQITDGPRWKQPAGGRTPRRTRRLVPMLAAAAVVAALAVTSVVIGTRAGHHHGARPAVSAHPTPSPSQPANTACVTTLPAAWTDAMRHSTLAVPGSSVYPLALAPDGRLLVARQLGSAYGVAMVTGSTTRWVYRVPDPVRERIGSADLWSHWAVISLLYGSGDVAPPNLIGTGANPPVYRLLIVDLRSGAIRQVPGMSTAATAQTGRGHDVDLPVLQDGTLYWDAKPRYAATTGDLHSYDIATGATRVVYSGPINVLIQSPAGVGYLDRTEHLRVLVPATDLPASVSRGLPIAAAGTLGTDGTTWVWFPSTGIVEWWRAGMRSPSAIRVSRPDASGALPNPIASAPVVSGDLLFLGDEIVDLRSGAVAPSTGGAMFGGRSIGETALYGTRGTVIGYADRGGMTSAVLLLRTTTLPRLAC